MNNLKSGGTLFLAYEGRMGRANVLFIELFNKIHSIIQQL